MWQNLINKKHKKIGDNATEKKKNRIDCCICFCEDSRPLKLNGKKLSSELFDVEHGLLLQDSDLCLELKSADAGIFRACHTKVKKSVQFVEQLRVNCKSFVCSPFHVKRIMPSPLTPKHSSPLLILMNIMHLCSQSRGKG